MNSVESSVSISPESKIYKLKQLVQSIQLYFQTRREDTAIVIHMHLQSLSATIDLSIFDPHSAIAPQFFVCLYDLMNKMEPRSPFAWNCVDVLSNICRNPMARQALIHTYQFIPSLSRLLTNQMSLEKKIRLLRLMQDLTCGIKISWQIPHLPDLMVTLSKWIESSEQDVMTLSIAIVANLCYKNLPAIYTLTSNVDVKKMLQNCLTMKGAIEIHTFKLLVILDYMNGNIPENILMKITQVTFESVAEAFRAKDDILLRQIVDFFLDVAKNNNFTFLTRSQQYDQQLERLLDVLQNNNSMETGEGFTENREPECISCIFEFLNFLIGINLPCIVNKYSVLIQVTLQWIQTDLVSSQALRLLKSIAVNVQKPDCQVLEPLIQGLPIFLNAINSGKNDSGPDYLEQNLKTAGLLQLLKIMAQVPSIRAKILEDLKLENVCKIFGLSEETETLSRGGSNDMDLSNIETVNLYVHGVALVNELAKHDIAWLNLQSSLMQNKQTHLILGHSLCRSSKEEMVIVLQMSSIPCFPMEKVAEVMSTLHNVSFPDMKQRSSHTSHDVNFPVLPVTQLKKVNSLLKKLEESFAQKQFSSVLTSDVIELYEYKLTSLGNAERAAMASMEAASERCTHLQHRNAQLTSELNRSHQLLYHVQQCHEQVSELNESLTNKVDTLTKKIDVDKGKLISIKRNLSQTEEELNECKSELDNFKKKYEKSVESRKDLEEQNSQLKKYVNKLEENSSKLQKILQNKEETLKKSNFAIDSMNMRLNELETSYAAKEGELQHTQVELDKVREELKTKKQVLETITKFALTSQEK